MSPSAAIYFLEPQAPSWSLPSASPTPSASRHEGLMLDARAHQRAALELGYRRSGGIATAAEVVGMMRDSDGTQPLSRLAKWIVAREVVSFEWQATTWLPLFQFEPTGLSVRPEVEAVIRELSDVFDDWELACWFTSPNTWLGNMTPVDAIAALPLAVKEAARVDRFVARG